MLDAKYKCGKKAKAVRRILSQGLAYHGSTLQVLEALVQLAKEDGHEAEVPPPLSEN